MELSQLRYFLAVANCGQISKAAEMVHISQSAISMAISRLEQELGVELLEKKGRGVQLTNSGARFVEMISPALAELDFARDQMRQTGSIEPHTVSLSLEMPDLATVLAQIFFQINPGTCFRQAMDTTEAARQKVKNMKVDFCMSFEPIREPGIVSLPVLTEPVLVQLPSEVPQARRESIGLKELSDLPFVSFAPEYSFRRWTDGMCAFAGFRPRMCFEACDCQSLVSIVRSHKAAAFISKSTYDWNFGYSEEEGREDSNGISYVRLNDPFCIRHVYISYHKDRILSEDAVKYLNFILQFKAAMEQMDSVSDAAGWICGKENGRTEI